MCKQIMLLSGLVIAFCTTARGNEITIIQDGKAKAALFVPERVMDDAKKFPEPASVWRNGTPDASQQRLRESVKDLAEILERISGAKVDIVTGAPKAGDKRVPILIGELAASQFGPPQKKYPYQQGLRIVVAKSGIGLYGESDLATSYAIYTLLDQLGCRWYMPGPLGEALPKLKTVTLPAQDLSTGPYTIFRGLWYCDNAFARRNRMGGMELSAGHALEFTVPKELRKTNPEIKAIVNGKPDTHKVKWTHPLVAKAISDAFLSQLAKKPDIRSFSLSPDDGLGWDESDDAKLDAGDFDPAVQMISKTDRLMVLANRVAMTVSAKHPNVLFGLLAYADYTRPPVREEVHPNVIPEIAPITFTRAHPMTDDGEPNNKSYRFLVKGWAKKVSKLSYYYYAFNLAETASPNPYITRWSVDLPILYQNKCFFWQPETITNFETTLHAHYLGLRLAWDPTQKPADIIEELHQKFYGAAAKEMAAYWHHIDNCWVKTKEYSGCGFGHLRRFHPTAMNKAHKFLDAARSATRFSEDIYRIDMANDSFRQFQLFMKLRHDLAEGRFLELGKDAKHYRDEVVRLADKYEANYAFGRMPWTGKDSIHGRYFNAFYQHTYDDAARVAEKFNILTPALRIWRYLADENKQGEAAGWAKAAFNDSKWKKTDVCLQTWSSLGHHDYMGSLWYRTQIKLPAVAALKKVYLWLGATDGHAKVFINGQHVPFKDAKGKTQDSFNGYCQPASFDITAAVQPGGDNQIALFCTRDFLNELGTGGMLAPAVVYAEK